MRPTKMTGPTTLTGTAKLIRTTRLIALTSALVASAALASAAEAGGGVRLGFGVPLGSFVATPAHGGGACHTLKGGGERPTFHSARRTQTPARRVAKAELHKDVVKDKAGDARAVRTAGVTTETPAPLTGSSALIQGAIPAATPAPQTAAPPVEARAAAATAAPTDSGEATADAPESCRKFIPAVGTTVAVGCN